jgi:mannan endo-1,4-beta-mannosidase
MRPLTLNLLTSAVTVALLIVLAVPAERALHAARGPSVAEAAAETASALPPRGFGVYVDPWHVDDWARAVGAAPQIVAKFEAFSRQRSIDPFLRESERQGIRQVMVSWEPWKPVPTSFGTVLQALAQPGYRNADIARGAQDAYISRFARSLATFHGIVWLRYAHEMNGFWYPWSHGPRNYVRAWRHVVRVVRANARNVRFVWSPNPSLFQSFAPWLRGVREYWPGARWVDVVGSTMIDFGGHKRYAVRRFGPRLRALRTTFGKPVMITEANTDFAGRVAWLRGMRQLLRGMPWVRAVAWSQLPSRGTVHMRGAGNLDWDVTRDPASAAILRGIIGDGRR